MNSKYYLKKQFYPTRKVRISTGEIIDEVLIPREKRKKVLEELYPFTPVPELNEEFSDLHSGKLFKAREYRVFFYNGFTLLTTPWFPETGGTVIDWAPASWAGDDEEIIINEVKKEHEDSFLQLMTEFSDE